MKDTVNDNDSRLDPVEHPERKSGDKDTAKRPELHRASLRMASDDRNRGIDTANKIKRRSRATSLIPESRLRHIVLRTEANDERVAH